MGHYHKGATTMTVERGMYSGDRWAGCPVYTRDGREIGEVDEKWGGYFKVDALVKPDFWLRTYLGTLSGECRIVVAFEFDELEHHKIEDPFNLVRRDDRAA
jgi:hypothetical protein